MEYLIKFDFSPDLKRCQDMARKVYGRAVRDEDYRYCVQVGIRTDKWADVERRIEGLGILDPKDTRIIHVYQGHEKVSSVDKIIVCDNITETWSYRGKAHRLTGPAFTMYDRDGIEEASQWLLHNRRYPAFDVLLHEESNEDDIIEYTRCWPNHNIIPVIRCLVEGGAIQASPEFIENLEAMRDAL